MNELDELSSVIASIKEPEKIRTLLDELLTQAELRNLSLRWKLMKMLKKGLSQRKIASELGISLCKITRGSRILKDPDSITGSILDSI